MTQVDLPTHPPLTVRMSPHEYKSVMIAKMSSDLDLDLINFLAYLILHDLGQSREAASGNENVSPDPDGRTIDSK